MARIGDTVRPELMRADTSGILRGSAAGAAALGQGIAAMATQLNQGFEKRRERKDFQKKTDTRMEGLVKMFGADHDIAKAAQGIRDTFANDDISGKEKFGVAQGAEAMLADMMQMRQLNLTEELGRGQLKVAQQQAGFAGRASTRADTKAAREESQYKRLMGDREDKTRALEMWYGAGGDLSGLNLEGEPLAFREGIAQLQHEYGQIAAKKTGSFGTTELGRTDADGIQWLDKTLTVNGVPQVGQVFGTRLDKQMTLTPIQQVQVAWQEKRVLSSEERVQEVIQSAGDSRVAMRDIQQAETLLLDPDTYTGAGKEMKQTILRWAAAVGMDTTKLSKMEQLDVLLGSFVMARVAQTKGAISNTEMQMFIDWSASGKKTKEGNLRIIQALKAIEERTGRRAAFALDLAGEITNSPQDIEKKLREFELNDAIWQPGEQFGKGAKFGETRPVISSKTPIANSLLGNMMRQDEQQRQQRQQRGQQQQQQQQGGGKIGEALKGFFGMFGNKNEAPQKTLEKSPAIEGQLPPDPLAPVGNGAARSKVVPEAKGWAGVSKWLSREELQSKDGAPLSMSPTFLRTADKMFDIFGSQPPITSGHRSRAHNEKQPGAAKDSQHIHGKALDLDMSGMGPAERMELLQAAQDAGITGIGFYPNSPNMLHIDTGRKRTWGTTPGWAKKIMEASGY